MVFIYTRYNKLKGLQYKKILKSNWGVQIIEYGILKEYHINFLKIFLSKKYKKFKLNYIFNKNLTKKALETRMGGGKGMFLNRIYSVKPGDILINLYTNSFNDAYLYLKEITYKLPVKLRLIKLI